MNSLKTQTRVRWIELEGKKVLLMEFAGAPVAESLQMIVDFDREMQGRAPASVMMLTDVTGAQYDPSIARQWKEARNRHDAVVRVSAMAGLSGLVGIAIRSFIEVRRFLGMSASNEPKVFERIEDAREWLGRQ